MPDIAPAPPAPIPAAKAAPSPAPKAAPAPSAPPAASPKPAEEVNEFESMDDKLYPKPKEPAKVEAPQEDDSEVADEIQEEAPVQKEEPKSKQDRTIESPKSMRAKLEQTLKEAKSSREALADRESKIAEFQSRSKDTTTLTERLAAVERERDAALSEARGLKQEVSPEFDQKYVQPYNYAAEQAKRFVEQLEVDNGDGTSRKATWERDFAGLYALPEVEAWKKSKEMFGDFAPMVMTRYERLHNLSETASIARQQERVNWQKTQTEQEANQIKEREASTVAFHHAEEGLKTKYPEWFAEDPTDPEGNELVKTSAAKLMERPRTMQEHVAKQATIKQRAENFPRLAHRLNKANERIAELEAKIASAGESEPGKVKRKAGQTQSSGGDWDSDLAALRNFR